MYLSTKGLFMGFLLILALAVSGEAQSEFIYVNDNVGLNQVSAFRVSSSGTLSEVAGSPFTTGEIADFHSRSSIVVSRATNTLYVTNTGSGTISSFSIDPATGFLTKILGSVTPGFTGESLITMAITPNNRFLIVAYRIFRGTELAESKSYSISPSGALTFVPGSQRLLASRVAAMKVSPDGKLLWVSDRFQKAIKAFDLSPSGHLTSLPGAGFQFDDKSGTPGPIETNCKGDGLYYLEGSSKIHVFNAGSDGSLMATPGSPFLFPASFVAILTPNQRFLFVGGSRQEPVDDLSDLPISELRVHDASRQGDLQLISGSPYFVATNSFIQDLDTNRLGSFLYSLSFGGGLTVFGGADSGMLNRAAQYFPLFRWNPNSTIAAYPPRNCAAIFDLCIQDDSTGSVFSVNTSSGDYRFDDCAGLIAEGKGSVTRRGCSVSLTHNALDRRVLARIDTCARTGMGTIQLLSQGRTLSFYDRSSGNLTCHCR